MGTNFYMHTKNKELAEKYAPYSYDLTDTPDWGYRIHIAKTSMGWLPLFQSHWNDFANCGIKSVADYKELYDTGEAKIYDEYESEYDWDGFDQRVLKFNGGVLGVKEPEKVNEDERSECYDNSVPEYIPISHLPGSKQSYHYSYTEDIEGMYKDPEGYEFETSEFC